MSDVLEQLHQDHLNMSRLLGLLARQLDRFHRARQTDYALMLDIMHYMLHYPDLFHHPREDLVCQRLMLRHPESSGLVARLLDEHRQLHKEGHRFHESLRDVVNDQFMRRETIEEQGRAYIARQGDHMSLEETKVFPLAREHLTREDWDWVAEQVAHREDPLFGHTVLDEYRNLYQFMTTDSPLEHHGH
ncbi:MAG: hemerythrin domain-containing protein [Gammaproteobacteria bacterium]